MFSEFDEVYHFGVMKLLSHYCMYDIEWLSKNLILSSGNQSRSLVVQMLLSQLCGMGLIPRLAKKRVFPVAMNMCRLGKINLVA